MNLKKLALHIKIGDGFFQALFYPASKIETGFFDNLKHPFVTGAFSTVCEG